MRLGSIACTIVAALATMPGNTMAQTARGIGDDALTAPRRSIRFQVSTTISDARERYGKGTPGRAYRSLEPLGVDFTTDTLGVAQFPGLGPLQAALRSLTGNSAFTLNLGRTQLASSVRVQATPIILEAGITNRLQFSALIPFVSARYEAMLNVNGSGKFGNVAFNPQRTADSAANLLLVTQLGAARTQLLALVAACTANSGASAACPAALATGPAIAVSADDFSKGITSVYGTTRGAGSAFVPIAGTAADSAIRTRVNTFRTQFNGFGITAISASTLGPARPSALLTTAALQGAIADSTLGLLAQPLETITRQGLGDIELALKLRVFDSFDTGRDTMRFLPRGLSLRQSIAGAFRLGTGTMDTPQHYLDVGTGHGQNDVEIRSFTDVVYGRRFFGSVVARYTIQLPDQLVRRITDTPEQVWAPAYRERLVERNLGDQAEIELTPRYLLSDFISIGAQYLFRRKLQDQFSGTFTVAPSESGLAAPVTLDAATLDQQTAATEQRLGWGLTFSTVAAHARGKARFPVEFQYFNSRTVAGSGGLLEKVSIHQVQVRWYPRG